MSAVYNLVNVNLIFPEIKIYTHGVNVTAVIRTYLIKIDDSVSKPVSFLMVEGISIINSSNEPNSSLVVSNT